MKVVLKSRRRQVLTFIDNIPCAIPEQGPNTLVRLVTQIHAE